MDQNLNLNALRYFRDAVALKSLSLAAKKNRVSQSAISQAIRKLEDQLGCPLLVHQRKRLELTDAGRTAYREGEAVFDQLKTFMEAIEPRPREFSGELRLGASHSVATVILPPVLNKMRIAHPRLRVSLSLGNSEVVRRWLSEGVIEGALVTDEEKDRPKNGRVTSQIVARGHYVLAASPSLKSPRMADLLVTRGERPEVRSFYRAYAKTAPSHPLEISSWEVMKAWVLAGLGTGIFPHYVVARELAQHSLKILHVPGWSHRYEIKLLRRGDSGKLALFSSQLI